MECNTGKIDRIIRFIIGIALIWAGYKYNAWWYLLAVILILTSFAGFCPLYKLFGINTCSQKEEEKSGQQEQSENSNQEASTTESQNQERSVLDRDDGPSIDSWKGPQQ